MARRLIVSFALVTVVSICVNAQGPVYQIKDLDTKPAVTKEVKPDYTAEAKAERIQGVVWLKVVVKSDGTVGDVQVTQSLDKQHGLDNQAVQAIKQWEFKPGRKGDKPVDSEVTVEMTFTLK
jgi:protein TonB